MEDTIPHNLTHTQQISSGVTKSLISAGIAKSYHKQRVSDIPNTAGLVAWLKSDLRQKTIDGQGATIIGNGANAIDATILTASVIHTMGHTSLVVPLTTLASWVQHETEDYWRAEECAALFITDFCQIYGSNKDPLTAWQIARIEVFLIARMTSCKSVYLHMAYLTAPIWWSSTFLQRVAKFNISFEVA